MALMEGGFSSALHAFFQAICREPGHEKADAEIDTIEAKVQGSTDPHDIIIRYNLDYVVKPVRHQPKGSPAMEADTLAKYVKRFVATVGSVQFMCDEMRESHAYDVSLVIPGLIRIILTYVTDSWILAGYR